MNLIDVLIQNRYVCVGVFCIAICVDCSVGQLEVESRRHSYRFKIVGLNYKDKRSKAVFFCRCGGVRSCTKEMCQN